MCIDALLAHPLLKGIVVDVVVLLFFHLFLWFWLMVLSSPAHSGVW
jgi:hypothetical protein